MSDTKFSSDDTLSFAAVNAALSDGVSLTSQEATWAMEQILSGNAGESEMATFLLALQAKGPTANEVNAFMDVMNAHALNVDVNRIVVDVVGTGGDSQHSVNISTMSAIVVASCGVPVVKHGNRAASSKTGAADVLEELGIPLVKSVDEIQGQLENVGIAFCFAPNFHPAMRFAAPVRKQLGVPTVFNILGPLANPANASAGLIGCADAALAPVMAQALAGRADSAFVVRGDDGHDEITTFTTTHIWDTTGGEVREHVLDPADVGIPVPPVHALRGGDRVENARLLRDTFSCTPETRAIFDAVRLNAAAALVAYDSAVRGGKYPDASAPLTDRLTAALADSTDAITSGAAHSLLQRWISYAGE